MPDIYDFEVRNIDGRTERLEADRGRVLLIVNVASRCGFTPQYAELESLYRKHREQGLTVLGFPCDQFGHQEPDDEPAIKSFCTLRYGVTFPMFAKIKINGPEAHPLYRYLKSQRRGFLGTGFIKWNFSKFLVDRQGRVAGRYGTTASWKRIERDVASLLAQGMLAAPHASQLTRQPVGADGARQTDEAAC